MRTLTITTLLISVTLISGCGQSRPANMPEVAPCSITVLKDGKPMANAEVTLYRSEGNGALSIGGTTNVLGVAEIQTKWGNYTVAGAPIGVCKVTVNKYFEVPPETVNQEETHTWSAERIEAYEAKRMAEIDKHRIVPRMFAESATTPFEITIAEKTGGTITVDVAAENHTK